MPIAPTVVMGKDVRIFQPDLVNLYGCTIGDETKIGAFVEIQKNAFIGARCKISSHTFICEGVTIEDDVFVGHGVMFINDLYPRATAGGALQTEADWAVVPTLREARARRSAAGAVILCGSHDRRGRDGRRRRGRDAATCRTHTIAGVPARLGRGTRELQTER